jgi:gluconolactonase
MRIVLLCIVGCILVVGCKSKPAVHQIGTFDAISEEFWDVVPRDAVAERIGMDFEFTEGPVWYPDGTLLFSDIPANTIYRWTGKRYEEFRKPSNHSNGLYVDQGWAVVACEHGSRSITRYSLEGRLDTLAFLYQGRRFNSPNDLCKAADGSIYFTDPPWGLEGRNNDPAKEIPFNGVYRLYKGNVTIVDSTLSWPNGIALSPDGTYLYVANFEQSTNEAGREVFWMRYTLDKSGKVIRSEVFFKAEDTSLPGGPDGMKVDKNGNLFLTGPGGILIVSQEGEHLGTIGLPIPPTNLAFDPRERTLYATARSILVRIQLKERHN